jgi:hypothetical protein
MPDLSVEDLRTQGGLKPAAVGRLILPKDGLIIVSPHAGWITSGKKKVIIKSKPFHISGVEFLLMTRNHALGIIKLSAPKMIGLKEFTDLESLHLIDGPTRKKFWPGHKEFWAYKIVMLKVFAEPIAIKPLTGPQVVAHDVELELKGAPSMFDLEKAEGDAVEEFAYRLKIIASEAAIWSKMALRFVTGPEKAVAFVQAFPAFIKEATLAFPTNREVGEKMGFPQAVEEAIEWGRKAARALDGHPDRRVGATASLIVEELRMVRQVIDAMERAEDEPMLKLEGAFDESNDCKDV